MKNLFLSARLVFLAATIAMIGSASAQTGSASATLNPMLSFTGDGWFEPGEGGYLYLGTGSLERSIAYGRDSNHLYLVSRANDANGNAHVRILNGTTGADVGELDVGSGIVNQGLFTVNMVSVADDGAIYVSNLAANASGSNPFKIYKWVDEASQPVVVYTNSLTTTERVGDSLDVFGSGANTVLAAGFNTTTSGYLLIDPTAGISSSISIANTSNGDFKPGISFAGSQNAVWGDQGANGIRRTIWSGVIGDTFTPPSGSLQGTFPIGAPSGDVTERPLDLALINGIWVLATIESSTTSQTLNNEVRLWDVTDAVLNNTNNRTLLASATLTSPGSFLSSAGNGSITWGAVNGANATLYAMSTNNGIQAYNIQVIPEPVNAALFIVAAGFVQFMRRRHRFPAQTIVLHSV